MFRFVLVLLAYYSCFSSADASHLQSQLRKTAGIYHDSSKSVGELKKTVLVTASNYGFLNQLLNFKCFADRLGLKFLVISMDRQVHEYINRNTSMISHFMKGGSEGEVVGAQLFRSNGFNLISARKIEAVHNIMKLGYNVIFSDTDVAIVRDPVPYLMWENVEYVHSLDDMCKLNLEWDFKKSRTEGNTGFYFVRSTPRTIKYWQIAYESCPKFPTLDDQYVFWHVIRKTVDPPMLPLKKCRHFNTPADLKDRFNKTGGQYLVSCVLDTCTFSSGMLSRAKPGYEYETLLKNLKTMNESMVTVHGNYLSGNELKVKHMKQYGFWMSEAVTDKKMMVIEDNGCRPYVQYIPPSNATKSVPTTKQ